MNLHTPRILCFAMAMSCVLYAVVGFIVQGSRTDPPPEDATLVIALAVAALGSLVASFLVPRFLLASAIAAMKIEVEDVPDPNAADVMFRDMPPTIARIVEAEKVKAALPAKMQTPFILSLALSESVGIFGVVLAVLGYDPMTWIPFIVVGFFAVASRFPSEARWLRAVEKLTGAVFR